MNLVEHYRPRGFDCVCGNLRMAARAVTGVYDKHLLPIGLQASQMAVLWAVAGLGGSPIKTIAQRIAMGETSLLRNLRVLERQGWIAIEIDETDRRQRLVSLTKAGEAVFAKALPRWERAQQEIAAVLEKGRVGEFNTRLLKLTRAVK
jgi:DNA-binding MarR family transcriptional regulator